MNTQKYTLFINKKNKAPTQHKNHYDGQFQRDDKGNGIALYAVYLVARQRGVGAKNIRGVYCSIQKVLRKKHFNQES